MQKAVHFTYPLAGTAEVQLREHPDAGEDVSVSGWIYHLVLEPGDSVAVTQHNTGNHDGPCTIFFWVKPDGSLLREEAPHGLTGADRDVQNQ